ncbi:olfactory receptor 14I1-like [Zootoca vivipara]|uniref:olfactory receptor 14I1-like n=1 Tax=Zootoca vivipara TaxID=8524 RepID=UPI00293BC225|nr:olfactory receptor 14I1-like [Zootoca vivipara]
MDTKEQSIVNQSSPSGFLLMEFSEVRELQILHFCMFLAFYLAALIGNILIISAVAFDSHLQTPMYFFLINLAIQDIGSVSVIMPKSMANTLLNIRYISYAGCVAQVFFFLFFLISDFFLLTVMAYDRYVAICKPLQYEMLMNMQACIQMVIRVWISSFLCGVLHTGCTFSSPLCSNVVNQFFCEVPHLLKMACSDLYLFEIGAIVLGSVTVLGCFIFIIATYVQIFTEVLKIPSAEGRQRAFSTCLPHLIVVSIFVFTGCFAYLKPTSNSPSHLDLAFTMIYSMVPPLMNPIIYSMRNKEVKNALSKLLGSRLSSMNAFSSFFFLQR